MGTRNTREFKQALAVAHRLEAQGSSMTWSYKSRVVLFLCSVLKKSLIKGIPHEKHKS